MAKSKVTSRPCVEAHMIVRELIKSDFLFQQIDVGTYTYSCTCNQNQVPARGETSPSDVLPALLLLFQYGLARSGGACFRLDLKKLICQFATVTSGKGQGTCGGAQKASKLSKSRGLNK